MCLTPCLCQVSNFIKGLGGDQLQSMVSLGQGGSSLPKLTRAWLAALQRLATAVELVRLWAFCRIYPSQHVHILKRRDLLRGDSFLAGSSNSTSHHSWPAHPLSHSENPALGSVLCCFTGYCSWKQFLSTIIITISWICAVFWKMRFQVSKGIF